MILYFTDAAKGTHQIIKLNRENACDKITPLNWGKRYGGDIYRSVEFQTSKEIGLL